MGDNIFGVCMVCKILPYRCSQEYGRNQPLALALCAVQKVMLYCRPDPLALALCAVQYLTPLHCQDMLDSLVTALNATHQKFLSRHPYFKVRQRNDSDWLAPLIYAHCDVLTDKVVSCFCLKPTAATRCCQLI